MTNFAIRVNQISKRYRIGEYEPVTSLREAISRGMKKAFTHLGATDTKSECTPPASFWALKGVSFDIKHGEVVGIIGRNGAGKSTLLKILSRITRPTEGCVEGYGRVGSLLEVGTGFHPELTGRENISLNGAILGMKKAEIRAKFDEIVAFAEFEEFLDTPVKRYSSGMYMRLAFAVAAHMDPDILIVDEVLAVGDAAFQKKCLGKMSDVAQDGRTIIFVSHNLGAIQSLCSRAIFLRAGAIESDSNVSAAVQTYLNSLEGQKQHQLVERTERRGKGLVRLTRVEIFTRKQGQQGVLMTGQPAHFVFHVSAIHPGMTCSFTIYDQLGQPVTYFDSAVHSKLDHVEKDSNPKYQCEVETLTLIPGRYRINAAIEWHGEMQDHLEGAAFFEVVQGELMGRPVLAHAGYGSVLLHHRWHTPQ